VNLSGWGPDRTSCPKYMPGFTPLVGASGPQEISIAFKGVDLARPSA